VRGIIINGVAIDTLWTYVLALRFFAVIIMGSAAARFRKRLD
jgi:hypothetical protein